VGVWWQGELCAHYLGPPRISPSSPVAGAAGARLLGSVPGAALQGDEREREHCVCETK
jgi:hypothetical protein